jgi:2,4-dienoyl-CoA reductase-like NADH-dependent reductase (Old Yellow Enzyme family)
VPYFHYRTLDDLRADVSARGLNFEVDDDIGVLAEGVRAGGRQLASRLVVQPMEGCDGNLDGTPGELTFRRWRRFAEGGASILWGEATAVAPEARANPRQLLISDATLPAIRQLLEETRAARRARFGTTDGFLVGLQLTHSGRWSHRAPIVAQSNATLAAVRPYDGGVASISDDELEQLEDRYVHAATVARDVGFDFVDIKQCHTYLLNELLGARSRDGRCGGDFEGRTRFVRNVFGKIRRDLGDSIMLATRMNVYDGVPYVSGEDGVGTPSVRDAPYVDGWGIDRGDPLRSDLSEPIRLVGELCALGLSMLNVSMGSPYYNPHIGRPFEKPPVDGYVPPEHPLAGVERHFRLTAEMQRAYPDLPIVGSGYSWLRHFALNAGAANVRTGGVTLVGLGRGALAYPDFAADALDAGAMERDKSCIGVSYCTALMRAKHNRLGQYATGCVPRDRTYAESFKDALRTEGWRG